MNDSSKSTHRIEKDVGTVLYSTDILHRPGKKRYLAPALEPQAHLRDITLGNSPGDTETFPAGFEAGSGVSQDASKKNSGAGSGIFESDIFD